MLASIEPAVSLGIESLPADDAVIRDGLRQIDAEVAPSDEPHVRADWNSQRAELVDL
jgi:hypothetical protein